MKITLSSFVHNGCDNGKGSEKMKEGKNKI